MLRRLSFRTLTLGACLGLPLVAAAPTAPVQEYLYVANTLGGGISILEIPAHRVVGTIPESVVSTATEQVLGNVVEGPPPAALPRLEAEVAGGTIFVERPRAAERPARP